MTPISRVLKCDICGNTMTQGTSDEWGRDTFSCSCGQRWTFCADGSSRCKILKGLYPQKMGYKLKQEFYEEQVRRLRFEMDALTILGKVTKEEGDAHVETLRKQADEQHEKDAAARRWWRFWDR